MSSMSDSASEASHQRKREPEDLGDDVSIVSTQSSSSFWSIAGRILLAVIFLSAGVGAVVYSVVNAEETDNSDQSDKLDDFVPLRSQFSLNGTLTIVHREPGSPNNYNVTVLPVSWEQDNTTSKLYFRVGAQEQYLFYPNISFAFNDQNCTLEDITYTTFFESRGLTDLPLARTEEVDLPNDQVVEVYVYEGEPKEDVTVDGRKPTLIRVYSSVSSRVLLGWETFFPRAPNDTLFRTEFWFPDMVAKRPDPFIQDPPLHCLRS